MTCRVRSATSDAGFVAVVRCFAAILMAVVVACADSPLDPNTDVGLRVWVQVSPGVASISDSTATIQIRLYIQNGSPDEITVISGGPPYRFTGNPANSSGLIGSIRIANDTDSLNAGPSTDWWGQPVYTFKPRSARYHEFLVSLKEWRARGRPLVAGEYRVRGWFNGREGKSAVLVLKP